MQIYFCKELWKPFQCAILDFYPFDIFCGFFNNFAVKLCTIVKVSSIYIWQGFNLFKADFTDILKNSHGTEDCSMTPTNF